jgi:hypothetical protein
MNPWASAQFPPLARRRRRQSVPTLTERAVADILHPRTGQVETSTIDPPEVRHAASLAIPPRHGRPAAS